MTDNNTSPMIVKKGWYFFFALYFSITIYSKINQSIINYTAYNSFFKKQPPYLYIC